jgi:hypothetical protein
VLFDTPPAELGSCLHQMLSEALQTLQANKQMKKARSILCCFVLLIVQAVQPEDVYMVSAWADVVQQR